MKLTNLNDWPEPSALGMLFDEVEKGDKSEFFALPDEHPARRISNAQAAESVNLSLMLLNARIKLLDLGYTQEQIEDIFNGKEDHEPES